VRNQTHSIEFPEEPTLTIETCFTLGCFSLYSYWTPPWGTNHTNLSEQNRNDAGRKPQRNMNLASHEYEERARRPRHRKRRSPRPRHRALLKRGASTRLAAPVRPLGGSAPNTHCERGRGEDHVGRRVARWPPGGEIRRRQISPVLGGRGAP
jgi:hypothetical protein